MERVGLREANVNFAKYIKRVKAGEEILLTDRGKPFAVIKPLGKEHDAIEGRLLLLEKQGILSLGTMTHVQMPQPTVLSGKALSEIVAEAREDWHE